MRAWWSQLLVPQKAANLRCRYEPSLLALEEPHQNTASGPDLSRMLSIRSPISSMAWSQLMRFHLPSVSFIGYCTRLSPVPCSRTEAPLAQCAPRLKGEPKSGS